jgi:uncharacterized protein YcnI
VNRRIGLVRTLLLGATAAAIVGWAAPAFAHVEVEADKTQAGATDVTVTFSAEAESNSAGVASLAVTLPPGIAQTDVTFVSGPAGWTLTPSSSGYTVGGPALPVGRNVSYVIKIAKLPTDQATLPFKTLQTYTDGRVDRWIDIQQPGQPEVDMPAPTLQIQGAVPATSAPATPTTAPEASTPTVTAATASGTNDNSGSSAVWLLAGGFALLAVIVGLSLWLRRRGSSAGSGTGTA